LPGKFPSNNPTSYVGGWVIGRLFPSRCQAKECGYFLVALRENIMGVNLRFLSSLNLLQPSSPVSISEKYGQPQKGNSWKKSMERPSEIGRASCRERG